MVLAFQFFLFVPEVFSLIAPGRRHQPASAGDCCVPERRCVFRCGGDVGNIL
jgi:hypothetical protein